MTGLQDFNDFCGWLEETIEDDEASRLRMALIGLLAPHAFAMSQNSLVSIQSVVDSVKATANRQRGPAMIACSCREGRGFAAGTNSEPQTHLKIRC